MSLTINPITGLPDLVGSGGSGGGIDGSGTAGTLAKFTDADTIADSVITEASGGVTVTQPTLGSDILNLTSTATGDDPNYRVIQGRAASPDDVNLITILTIPLALNTAYLIETKLIARCTAGNGGGTTGTVNARVLRTLAKRVGGGAVVTAVSDTSFTGDGSIVTSVTASGNNVIVAVKGNNGDASFVFHATATVQSVSA